MSDEIGALFDSLELGQQRSLLQYLEVCNQYFVVLMELNALRKRALVEPSVNREKILGYILLKVTPVHIKHMKMLTELVKDPSMPPILIALNVDPEGIKNSFSETSPFFWKDV